MTWTLIRSKEEADDYDPPVPWEFRWDGRYGDLPDEYPFLACPKMVDDEIAGIGRGYTILTKTDVHALWFSEGFMDLIEDLPLPHVKTMSILEQLKISID